jgi:hypothetical protein
VRTPNSKCGVCGKPLYRRPFELKKIYFACCKECRSEAYKKYPNYISLKNLDLGRKKGTNHLKGIPKSNISKIKRSKSMKKFINNNPEFTKERAKNIRGEKHYNWKGGQSSLNQAIRSLHETRKWQQEIKKRDKKCMNCDSIKELEAHHIVGVSKMIEIYNIKTRDEAIQCNEFWDLNNGITYCKKCHYEIEGRKYDKN